MKNEYGRFKAFWYSKRSKYHYSYTEKDKEYLRSYDTHLTKIKEEDLPSYFFAAYKYWGNRDYLNMKRVKKLIYRPCYATTNHAFKDDMLVILFDDDNDIQEVEVTTDWSDKILKPYEDDNWWKKKQLLFGYQIIEFINQYEALTGTDVYLIREEIEHKARWYLEQNKDEDPRFVELKDINRFLSELVSTWKGKDEDRPVTISRKYNYDDDPLRRRKDSGNEADSK